MTTAGQYPACSPVPAKILASYSRSIYTAGEKGFVDFGFSNMRDLTPLSAVQAGGRSSKHRREKNS